jgi:hypothetical protein
MMVTRMLLFLAATLNIGLVLAAPAPTPTPLSDIDSGKVLAALGKTAYDNALSRIASGKSNCTSKNVQVRKEWYVGHVPVPLGCRTPY